MITNEVFRGHLKQVFGSSLPHKILVALSGGVDSVCLTYLLCQYRDQFQPDLQISAVTIDHGYRPGSNKEAHDVGQLVKPWGVDHKVKVLVYGRKVGEISNFEEVARNKRYEYFQDICRKDSISDVLLAHNLNDQLETYLQRLQQNSSFYGLLGLRVKSSLPVPSQRPEDARIHAWRPFLEFDKADIINTCKANGISWFEDYTNKDADLTKRNHYRHLINEVIPQCNDKYSVISKQSLIDTKREIADVNRLIAARASDILMELRENFAIEMDKSIGSLTIRFPSSIFNEDNIIVLSRLIYDLIYPISSVKHYHWSYAKIERKLLPQIVLWLQAPQKPLCLTYLNLAINCKLDEDTVVATFSRQPLLKEDIARESVITTIDENWSDWILFDRRYWLRFKTPRTQAIQIVPYHPDLYKLFKASFPNELIDHRKLVGVPVILSTFGDEMLALPTLNLFATEINADWHLKPLSDHFTV